MKCRAFSLLYKQDSILSNRFFFLNIKWFDDELIGFIYLHINLHGLFNTKSTLFLEGQMQYYIIHWWEDKGVHTFPKGICPKVNIITRLEFEITGYDSAVQCFNRLHHENKPDFNDTTTCLMLFHAQKLGNWIQHMFIFTFFVKLSVESFFCRHLYDIKYKQFTNCSMFQLFLSNVG